MPLSASDGLQVSYATPVPTKGLLEGIDAASLEYPGDEYTPSCENVRFSTDTWATRLGYVQWQTLPGAGSVRLLDNLYQSNAAITRLAAQGNGASAQLYELREGTDASFQAASGGSGLGGTSQNLFQGVTNDDSYYFTDRAGALKKYRPTNWSLTGTHVVAVTQPAKPVAAATATPRWYNRLEDWASGWNDSDPSFTDSDDTSVRPPPAPATKTRVLLLGSGSAVGQTITKPTPATNLNSHTIAFWVFQDILKSTVDFQFGIGSATDYDVKLRDNSQVAGEWYPIFAAIGDIDALNYVRFQALTAGGTPLGVLVSTLFLPGRLEGEYRWRYTHYDPTNSRESAPSDPTNGGQPLDFSAIGQNWDPNTSRAFAKSCCLRFTSDSGTDSSTTKMRVYRSGGVPSLTVDENGNDLWLRVAEVPDYASTLTQLEAANSGVLHLATVPATLTTDHFLVVEPGTVGKEEYLGISGVTPGTPGTVNVNLGGGTSGTTQYSHANGSTVRIAFIDNVANEQIDVTTPIDVQRDDPPTGARIVARSPEGRLVLLNYTDKAGNKHPSGIAWSNKPTPDRPHDEEVFPDGVDPLTTRSLTQGWRADYTGGVAEDEEIVWGGFYRGTLHFLTRRALYAVEANSQNEWGPTTIIKRHNTGCIAGDTVQEAYGSLYWVADGPRVVKWTGGNQEPESISDLRVNVRLQAAPQSLWGQWLAQVSTTADGHYYRLYFTPAGQTLNTERLDYNIDRNAWEPVVYYAATGSPLAYQAAAVRAGNTDSPDLYQVDSMGRVIQTETGSLDGTVPIKVTFATNKISLKRTHPYWEAFVSTSLMHSMLIRLAAVTDSATITATTGGSEYPMVAHSYTIDLSGTGDKEIKIRFHRDLVGRWVQIQITGNCSNRPAFRDLALYYLPWRVGRISSNH